MLRFNLLTLIIIIVTCIAGCAKAPGSSTTVLIPWSGPGGSYQLSEVTLHTLSSPFNVRGTAAEVYYQPKLTDSGFIGLVARTHLTKAGNVYIPLDVESSKVLAVYSQFEDLYDYEVRLGTVNQLTWPRKVGVDLLLRTDPGSAINNALYFPKIDVTAVVPFTLPGVPFVLNRGIIAHEHFHAHFESQVGKYIGSKAPTDNRDLYSTSELNDLVLRGWNEGLADLFAAIYTGDSNFFLHSYPQAAELRVLSEPTEALMPAVDIIARANNKSSPLTPAELVGMAYTQGTQLARVLYSIAKSGPETLEQFQIRILTRIGDIPAEVLPIFYTRVMDVDIIMPILLKDYPLSRQQCQTLSHTLTKNTYQNKFSLCK